MSDVPHEPSVDPLPATSVEDQADGEETRREDSIAHHKDSFSLSALFLLTVTVAAILGFVGNALPGRAGSSEENSYQAIRPKEKPLEMVASAVLLLIAMVEGGRAGYMLKRRFTTMFVGIFYGMIAAAIAAAALFYPPSWIMVLFSCGMLFGVGAELGSKAKKRI